jgi:hypothetical protein
MTQLTAEEMQGMSPEEIELLSEGLEADGTPVEAGSATTPAPDDSDEDPDDDAPAAAPAPAATPAEAQTADQSATLHFDPKAEEPAGQVVDDEPATAPAAFVPQYSAEVPADAQQQIDALRSKERAAFKQLMAGESDMDEDAYEAIRAPIEQQIDDLKAKMLTASIFKQATEQAQVQRAREEWETAKAQAFEKFKADGLDYSDPKRPGLMAAYNHHLKALGSNPANEDKTGTWFLKEADRLTREDLGIKPAPPALAKPARGVDRSAIPPTLSRVPPSADSAISGDEFSHLSSLDGAALEKAIAKMTNEELDRYLA